MDNRRFWDRFSSIYDGSMRRFSPECPALIERVADDAGNARRILEVATGTGPIAIGLHARGVLSTVSISRRRWHRW
jgi:hypothetical protein